MTNDGGQMTDADLTTAKNLRIGVCYDFRNPPDSGVSHQYLYQEIMSPVVPRVKAELNF